MAHNTDMPHSIQKSHIQVDDRDITSMRDFLIADKFNKQSVEQTILFFFRLYILQLITLTACASNLATFWLSEVWDTVNLCQPEIAIYCSISIHSDKFLCNSLIRHILIQLQLAIIPGNFAILMIIPVCTIPYIAAHSKTIPLCESPQS